MCTRECVCVWCVHWAIYVCTHKIFVWGAAPCMYVWHRCDVPRASPNLHIHACAYVHICCMSAVVCAPAVGTTDQDSSPATWGWVLVMEGLPTLVARCPGFSVLTPALLRPPTVSLANPGSRQIWSEPVNQLISTCQQLYQHLSAAGSAPVSRLISTCQQLYQHLSAA